MPYLDRLLQDSGVAVPPAETPVAVAGAPETDVVGSPDVIETVEIGPVLRSEPAPSSLVEHPPASAATPEQPSLSALREAEPSGAAASTPAPTSPPQTGLAPPTRPESLPSTAPDVPVLTLSPPDAVQPTTPVSPAFAAPEPEPGQHPAERVRLTLAAVREWTASTPERGAPPRVMGQEGREAETSGAEPDWVEVTREPPLPEVRPRTQAARAEPYRPEAPPTALEEPEVMNFSLNIGAIELTIDAPSTPTPEPPIESVEPFRNSATDHVERLRRHYYRTPIGW